MPSRFSPIFEATEFFRPFPNSEDVFSADVELHSQHFLPLATVELSHISPELRGVVHFIQPIEPYDGVVGEGGDDFFTYLCRPNWIGYRYAGNLCSLATDIRFLAYPRLRAMVSLKERQQQQMQHLSEYYQQAHAGFDRAHEHYLRYGSLHAEKAAPPYDDSERIALATKLGGPSFGGNWAECVGLPLIRGDAFDEHGEEWDTAVPLTEDGREFIFVGDIRSWHYVISNASILSCDILLFYDPKTHTAVTTFDWS